jgi:ABC-type molybdate transport system substrate-binding protein
VLPDTGGRLCAEIKVLSAGATKPPLAIMSAARSPQPAAAFIRYLTGKEGRAVFVSKGFMAPRD